MPGREGEAQVTVEYEKVYWYSSEIIRHKGALSSVIMPLIIHHIQYLINVCKMFFWYLDWGRIVA